MLARTGAAKAIRLAAGLSLAEVASPIDVAAVTAWRWESGQRVPQGAAALRYGALLDELVAAGQGGRPRKAATAS